MYDTFSKWIKSYRDLPLKINQWANIVRWEMRPRLFLRTLEFIWQEGHTAHAIKKEADDMTKEALNMYHKFVQDFLAIHSVPGIKSEAEKFAGALYTLSVEALMLDGKALQMGTSHQLGQNFSKAFGIKYLDKKGKQNYVWQTSWGTSTRMIGGLIMAHGDDKGLVLPPKIAPYQIVIVPIWTNSKERAKIKQYILRIEKILLDTNIRLHTDWRTQQTPGWKFNEWELKGAPIRLEIGPNEAKSNKITFVSRDTLKKESISLNNFEKQVEKILENLQKRLLAKSKKFTQDHTYLVKSYSDFKKIIKKGGFVKAYWCGDDKCEERTQKETKATIRCILKDSGTGKCVKCGKKSKKEVLFAKAY
jgi:prolyl-tRNA synthetase